MDTSGNSERGGGGRDRKETAERALLAALCQGSLSAAAQERVLLRLARHSFSVPEQEVLFQALRKLPAGTPERTREGRRELLITRLTRLGFPDFDIERFFCFAAPGETELPALFADL